MGRIVISENVSLDGVVQDPAGDEGFSRGGWVGLIKDSPELNQLALDEGVHILVVYGESDPGLDYLYVLARDELRASIAQGAVSLEVVTGADHTFTLLASQRRLVDAVGSWLVRTYGEAHVSDEAAAAITGR